jgi:hypothetical protein
MWLITFLVLSVSGLCYGSVRFNPSELPINIEEVKLVQVIVENETEYYKSDMVALNNERTFLAKVDAYLSDVKVFDNGSWTGEFNVTGMFIGFVLI